MNIREANTEDLIEIIKIRNYYILNSNALFETEPDTPESKKEWFRQFQSSGNYRMLVAEIEKQIVGFAYSSQYRSKDFFPETVEVSVYADQRHQGKGIGSSLYSELFQQLEQEDIHLMVAGIAIPNSGSVKLHKKFGFEEIGVFKDYALKNGNYISSLWMQKIVP